MAITSNCLAEDVRLKLHNQGDFVVISIENFSTKEVRISKLFTQNPAFGLISLKIMVNGRPVRFNSPPNENLPSKSDYVTLRPFDVIGRALYISDIRRSYGVTAKCFSMSAKYHDVFAKKFDSFSLTIDSNQIHICQQPMS
jgi:hypothetical protein